MFRKFSLLESFFQFLLKSIYESLQEFLKVYTGFTKVCKGLREIVVTSEDVSRRI